MLREEVTPTSLYQAQFRKDESELLDRHDFSLKFHLRHENRGFKANSCFGP
jgi:hypothetical protein